MRGRETRSLSSEGVAFWAVWLFIASVPVENVFVIPGLGTLAWILGAVAGLVVGSTMLVRWGFRWHPFMVFGGAFALWCWTSNFWSMAPESGIERSVQITQLLLITWIVYNVTERTASVDRLLAAYVLGGLVGISFLLYSFANNTPIVGSTRYAAAGFNPNDFAYYLNVGLPMAWYLAMKPDQKTYGRTLGVLYVPLAVGGVLLTASRSGAVTCVLALLCIALFSWRRSRTVLGIVALLSTVVVVVWYAPPANIQRIVGVGSEILHGDWNLRRYIWNSAIETWSDSPIIGVGIGGAGLSMMYSLGSEWAIHNVYLSLALQVGLIGLVLWLAVWVSCYGGIWRLDAVEMGLWMSMAIVIVVSFMSVNAEWRKPTWLVMALVAAHIKEVTSIRMSLKLSEGDR